MYIMTLYKNVPKVTFIYNYILYAHISRYAHIKININQTNETWLLIFFPSVVEMMVKTGLCWGFFWGGGLVNVVLIN